MSESFPDKLNHANKLMREGKFQEALEVVNSIEKKGALVPGDQLSLLILKGKILTLYQRHRESARVGKLAYRLSQSLGRTNETITSLLFKANSLFLGQYDKALKYLFEAENLLNSLSEVSPSYLTRQRKNILFRRAWAHLFKGDINEALEAGLECLEIQEKFGSKSEIAFTLQLLGGIYDGKGEHDLAFDYASRSLTIFKEIGNQTGMGTTLSILGNNSYYKGEPMQALKYCKKSLSSKLISTRTKLDNINILGFIYSNKGELDKALKYFKQGIALAEKENFYNFFAQFQSRIGFIYVLKEEYDRAIEYLKPGLSLAEKMNDIQVIILSLMYLVLINLEKDVPEEAQEYLERLKKLEVQFDSRILTHGYLMIKAMLLIKTGGSRNRAEAEALLKQISAEETLPEINATSLIYLCEFYLEELIVCKENLL
jgi:tetratricopeptide (TPR) repeat protein